MTVLTIDPMTLQAVGDMSCDLLGEVVSWESPSEVTITDLRYALKEAGFPESLARDMLPRNAWLRAVKQLEEGRVIRKIEDAGGMMLFQFTREYMDSSRKEFDYQLETILKLEKATGKVSCSSYALEDQAQKLIDKQMGVRSASDVTAIIQRLCRAQADLFPIRRQGGVYFVPERHAWIIGSLGCLLNRIGGTLIRFPVPAGSETGRATAGKVIKDELHSRIAEHVALIEGYTENAPEEAMSHRALALLRLQGEIESYDLLLEDLSHELKEHMSKAQEMLRAKMEEAASASASA